MDYPIYEDKRSSAFTMASLVLGIVALATGCCVYTAIICGALAVMFALLSRGGERTMSNKAKIGLGLGIAGIVLGLLMLVSAFAYIFVQFGSFENYMDYYFDFMKEIPQSL